MHWFYYCFFNIKWYDRVSENITKSKFYIFSFLCHFFIIFCSSFSNKNGKCKNKVIEILQFTFNFQSMSSVFFNFLKLKFSTILMSKYHIIKLLFEKIYILMYFSKISAKKILFLLTLLIVNCCFFNHKYFNIIIVLFIIRLLYWKNLYRADSDDRYAFYPI